MNLIDIASWQKGLDLAELFQKNKKLDGVIVKVSQGAGYVNPEAKAWLDWLISNGKCAGTYHYLDLMGAEAEAHHYAEAVKPWLGKAALAIDYEGSTIVKGTGYLKACLDEVYRLTGVKPMVYCSQSVTQQQNFSAIATAGYKLWVAQYADMKEVHGFVAKPWQQGSVSPFAGYAMHQYTSCGRLSGWGGCLDFDLFNGTAADWASLCWSSVPEPAPAPVPETLNGADPVIIGEVLSNRYGTGAAREQKLREDGYDPQKVQAKINELYAVAARIKPLFDGNMDYINPIIKIVRQI